MKKLLKKFTPRKIRDGEKPRKTRAKNLEKARLNVMKNYERLTELVKKLEPEVSRHNKKVDDMFSKQLKEAAEKAEKKGISFSYAERKRMEEKRSAEYRHAFKELYYRSLQEFFQELVGVCEPDIDEINPYSIRPGGVLVLRGTCFGPSQGKVLLKISSENIVELEAYMWSETLVYAQLNPIIAEVPLRPYYGGVWLQTGSGETSNIWPIMYYPIYSVYIATWIRRLWGGVWGNSENDTFLENRNLGDPDCTIEWVERHHWGDGWSELRSPNAGGQSLAQGYHIGVAAAGHANMELLYRVVGPKGIDPPYISELGPWGWLGDYW